MQPGACGQPAFGWEPSWGWAHPPFHVLPARLDQAQGARDSRVPGRGAGCFLWRLGGAWLSPAMELWLYGGVSSGCWRATFPASSREHGEVKNVWLSPGEQLGEAHSERQGSVQGHALLPQTWALGAAVPCLANHQCKQGATACVARQGCVRGCPAMESISGAVPGGASWHPMLSALLTRSSTAGHCQPLGTGTVEPALLRAGACLGERPAHAAVLSQPGLL